MFYVCVQHSVVMMSQHLDVRETIWWWYLVCVFPTFITAFHGVADGKDETNPSLGLVFVLGIQLKFFLSFFFQLTLVVSCNSPPRIPPP